MNLSFASLYWYANRKGLLTAEFWNDNRATGKLSLIGIIGLVIAVPSYLNTYLSFALGIIIFTAHLFKRNSHATPVLCPAGSQGAMHHA